jgi:TatD DNase family protein
MPLVDIGVNLMHPSFNNDREEVIENACNVGVNTFIITGSNINSSFETAAYIAHNSNSTHKLYFTAGIHPHEANTFDDNSLSLLKDLAAKGAVAIGECGLDYFRDFSPGKCSVNVLKSSLNWLPS